MFFGGKFGAKRGMYVLLRWLWKWQGLVQREGQARQGCLKRVCPRALQGRKANQAYTALHSRGRGLGLGIINLHYLKNTIILL